MIWIVIILDLFHSVLAIWPIRILYEGEEAKMLPLYLTPKPKIISTTDLARGLVFNKTVCNKWFGVDKVIIMTSWSYFRNKTSFLR